MQREVIREGIEDEQLDAVQFAQLVVWEDAGQRRGVRGVPRLPVPRSAAGAPGMATAAT
jgi:hypothetical protein